METENNGLLNYVGKLTARELMPGQQSYQRYKLTFNANGVDTTFTAFMPWIKKDGTVKKGVIPDVAVIGKEYKLGYLTKGEYKTIAAIFEFKPSANGVIFDPVKDPSWLGLVNAYFELKKIEDMTENHFLGTMIRTKYPELVKPLLVEYNQRVNEQLPKDETK